MMHGQFVISRGIRDIFVTEQELRRQARQGLVAPGDRVYHPQLGRWLYAREVLELEEELQAAEALLRPEQGGREEDSVLLVPVNQWAVAGMVLGGLSLLPFVGLFLSGMGMYASGRGMVNAPLLYGSGYRLAVAGLILSMVLFVPQLWLAVVVLCSGAGLAGGG